MGNQLESVQLIGKWYAKPQVLVPAAGLAYMIYNKKTRKTGLYILAAGAAYVYYSLRTLS
jgi:hypothetical protein